MNPCPKGEQALSRLMDGNHRYMSGNPLHPNQSPNHRLALRNGQTPFAAVLGCADSRVPPDIIFDQGLGDLFVVRVAGNIVDSTVLGSLEFAIVTLRIPLLMVLGHARCGAVEAAMSDGVPTGHLFHIAQAIRPSIEHARNAPGDLLDNAIRANVRRVSTQLRTCEPILAGRITSGQAKVVAAYYHLDSGQVEILPR
jgi:carbonic anhydrase